MEEKRKTLKAQKAAKKMQKEVKKHAELLKKIYSIIELLSTSGGFATVLKGKNIGLDRWEAIKVIDVDSIEDAGLTLEKVEQEITMLAKLDHKHIVRVHNRIRETTEEWDYIFMIMELCDSTLEDILKEFSDGVPKGKARELLRQIVKGVEYLLSQGIIHRDLKPGNIFLKEGQVKIGDFNISKEIGIETKTRPSQMVLTYNYASPERAVHHRPGDKKVDIWSIGVIYYRLLQGQLPFTGDIEELLQNIGNISYPPLTKGDEFDLEVIRMCLLPEKDRADITQLKNFINKGTQPIMPKQEIFEEKKTIMAASKVLQLKGDLHLLRADYSAPKTMPLKHDCDICCDTHEMSDILSMWECSHLFCKKCMIKHIMIKYNEQFCLTAINCPLCEYKLSIQMIKDLIEPHIVVELEERAIDLTLPFIKCPKCKARYDVANHPQRKITCHNKQCKIGICRLCKQEYHAGACTHRKKQFILFKEAGLFVMACPYCLNIYAKDNECDHVNCHNCKKDFCFRGSCKRTPTIEHGNHYHRPSCKYFSEFTGADEVQEKCTECKKLGKICPRPIALEDGDIPIVEQDALLLNM